MNLLNKLEMVLVEPVEAGNVGACARALKNMGFASFRMVNPRYEFSADAKKMAVHAKDVLEASVCYNSLADAISDVHWVVGTSCRSRVHTERKSPIGPGEFVARLKELPEEAKVAVVFGSERTGLTNAQLGLCTDILFLETASAYPSLNLAQAVLLVAWEVRKTLPPHLSPKKAFPMATAGDMKGLIEHMRHTLNTIGYLNPQNPDLILDELRGIFSRAKLDPRELNLIRGIFHKMDVWIEHRGSSS